MKEEFDPRSYSSIHRVLFSDTNYRQVWKVFWCWNNYCWMYGCGQKGRLLLSMSVEILNLVRWQNLPFTLGDFFLLDRTLMISEIFLPLYSIINNHDAASSHRLLVFENLYKTIHGENKQILSSLSFIDVISLGQKISDVTKEYVRKWDCIVSLSLRSSPWYQTEILFLTFFHGLCDSELRINICDVNANSILVWTSEWYISATQASCN